MVLYFVQLNINLKDFDMDLVMARESVALCSAGLERVSLRIGVTM